MVIEENKIGGYSLIMMDCNMPIMNGYEASEALVNNMKDGLITTIPIIGTSAYSNEEELHRCQEAGMTEVIRKPITFSQLKLKLKEYKII